VRVVSTLDFVEDILNRLEGETYEIIIAEDGSSDGTDEVAKRLAEERDEVLHLHADNRLGRGLALKNALAMAKGSKLVYMDADLATDPRSLHDLVMSLQQADMVIGSRYMQGSRVKRPLIRNLASIAYNLLVRLIFKDGVSDHQCGFKAFRRTFLDGILDSVVSHGWSWDTEIIVRAKRKGYSVLEIPVEHIESDERKSKINLFRDTARMALGLLRLWLDLHIPSKPSDQSTISRAARNISCL
jgi:glycosyltransferase involved in cell wall biosynthesis